MRISSRLGIRQRRGGHRRLCGAIHVPDLAAPHHQFPRQIRWHEPHHRPTPACLGSPPSLNRGACTGRWSTVGIVTPCVPSTHGALVRPLPPPRRPARFGLPRSEVRRSPDRDIEGERGDGQEYIVGRQSRTPRYARQEVRPHSGGRPPRPSASRWSLTCRSHRRDVRDRPPPPSAAGSAASASPLPVQTHHADPRTIRERLPAPRRRHQNRCTAVLQHVAQPLLRKSGSSGR